MASLNDIRTKFLDYFAEADHAVVPSSPLVPRNDPTDTGGLFIGRRPGTAPVQYRTPPERGSARRDA